jgi:hypothetical protein
MVKPQQVQNGRVQIENRFDIGDRIVADLIGGACDAAALYPATP